MNAPGTQARPWAGVPFRTSSRTTPAGTPIAGAVAPAIGVCGARARQAVFGHAVVGWDSLVRVHRAQMTKTLMAIEIRAQIGV